MTINTLPNNRIVAVLSSAPGQKLPWNYLEHMQGWLYKHFLSTPFGAEVHKAPFSLFNYSFVPIDAKNSADGCASVTGNWVLRFASAYPDLLDQVYTQMQKEKQIELDHNSLGIITVIKEQLSDSFIMEAQPITIISKDKASFISPEDSDFALAVNAGLNNRWKYLTGTQMPDVEFCFTDQPKKKIIHYKNRHITAYQGPIRLAGSKESIRFAQCVGLGNKSSCGFGMVV